MNKQNQKNVNKEKNTYGSVNMKKQKITQEQVDEAREAWDEVREAWDEAREAYLEIKRKFKEQNET